MFSDVMIEEVVFPTNGTKPMVFIPPKRHSRFGESIAWSQIQPASLDVRLGSTFLRHPSGEEVEVAEGQAYSMAAGECLLASLVETVEMRCDNVSIRVEGKSSWARKFLTIHAAGFVDPGFCGDITLELKNDGHSRIELRPGVPIAQLSFHFLDAPARRLYGSEGLGSHYQYQKGPTSSWS
jgi:dCTP deaminase